MSGVHEMPVMGSGDEPAVRNPQLRAMVQRARDQRVPPLRVTADDLTLEWARARTRQRWTMGAMAVAAAVLVAAFVTVQNGRRAAPESPAKVASQVSNAAPRDSAGVELPLDTRVSEGASKAEAPHGPVLAPVLAPGIVVESVPPAPGLAAAAPAVVLGAWEVEVASGSYLVEVPPGAVQVFEVLVHKRVLEVEPDSQVLVHAGEAPRFEVRQGRAHWAATPESASAPGREAPVKDHAATMARKAEAQLADGNAKGALATLDQLVRKHPNSSSAKAAVLDLARLHRRQGHAAQARCAYELYLERWPTTRLRADVHSALAKLGTPGACSGLDPK